MHNVGFKEISLQFYSEFYNKHISSYSYFWDHMGLKSLPKLPKSEKMKTLCFLLKKWTEIHQKLTLCTRRGWLVWSCLRAAVAAAVFWPSFPERSTVREQISPVLWQIMDLIFP